MNNALRNLKILFIEDDDVIRVEFNEILNRMFDNVIVARNGSDGLFIFEELYSESDGVDLIISDVDMPVMNGIELLENVRKIDKKIPFIFTTAHTEVAFLQKAISLNVNEYLVKPVSIKVFQTKIEEIFKDLFQVKKHITEKKALKKYTEVVDKVAVITKTDTNGIITYVNRFFCDVSGYTKEELLGQNHNIVRHQDMPKEIFKELWSNIQNGKVWRGKLKNKKKDGTAYFTNTTIIPLYDKHDKEIIEYIGIRFLTTKEELEKREFKKKVITTLQESRKTDYFSKQKITHLENELTKYKSPALTQTNKINNNSLIRQIEAQNAEIIIKNKQIIQLKKAANINISKAAELSGKEKIKKESLKQRIDFLEKQLMEKDNKLTTMNSQIKEQNKTIINLKDVIEHREDQLGLNKKAFK